MRSFCKWICLTIHLLFCVIMAAGCTQTVPDEETVYANLIYYNGQYYRYHSSLSVPVSELDLDTQAIGQISEFVPSGTLPAKELSANAYPQGTEVYIATMYLSQEEPDSGVFPEIYVSYSADGATATYIHNRISGEEAKKPMLTISALEKILDRHYDFDTFRAYSGQDVSFEDYIYAYNIAGSAYTLRVRSHLGKKVDSLLLTHDETGTSAELMDSDLSDFLAEQATAPATVPIRDAPLYQFSPSEIDAARDVAIAYLEDYIREDPYHYFYAESPVYDPASTELALSEDYLGQNGLVMVFLTDYRMQAVDQNGNVIAKEGTGLVYCVREGWDAPWTVARFRENIAG